MSLESRLDDKKAAAKETPKSSRSASLNLGLMNENGSSENSASVRMREDIDIETGYYFHRQKLGEGGFSKVRLATHLTTGQKVAIKCMEKNKLGEDLFRVKTEIKALKVLQHETIAKLFQVIETETKIYLILEYCSGGELFDYIVAKTNLSEAESQSIIKSLIQCLAYLHSNGFAHRDLKPENILFDENHAIKLIDFGLAAHHQNSLAQLKTCCGSPAYAAPELISGMSYSGQAVDVWSAGILLYALLVGQLPFDDDNIATLYKKIQAGKYHMPTRLSPSARSVLRNMLQVDPKNRISVQDLLKHPWLNGGVVNDKDGICFQVQKDQIDEEVLWCCWQYFKDVPLNTLKHNIVTRFGYQTATYWLLKDRKKKNQPLMTTCPPKPQKMCKSVESGLEHITEESDIHTLSMATKSEHSLETKKKKSSPEDGRPKLVAAKRKLMGGDESEVPEKRREVLPCLNSPRGTRFGIPNPVLPRPLKTPVAPSQVRAMFASPSRIPVPVISPPPAIPEVVKAIKAITPSKKTRMAEIFGKTPSKDIKFQVKSPLRDSNASNPSTPNNKGTLSQTPKKSLLKRILASATPSEKPRNIAPSTTKNITMTSFGEPQECINKLVESLAAKGIQCKQKGFEVRCAKNDKYNNNVLTFNLEVCQFGGKCAIQRKRLRGDAWHYKKICEEILRISNESTATESQV